MKKFFGISLLVVILILVGSLGYYFYSLNPKNSDTTQRDFTINQGDSLKMISQRLYQNGYIKDPYVFMLYSKITGLNTKLQAGNFRLSTSLSTPQIIDKLSKGGSLDFWVKLLEGWRNLEITQYLEQNQALNSKEFLVQAKDIEGQIFPDSYLVPSTFQTADFLALVKTNFQNKIAQAKTNSTVTNLNDQQVLILASILEREARTPESKAVIAGILLNRLEIDMALQVDATVQYAKDSLLPHPNKFWQPITKNDLQINSIYNSYLNTGLPPGPICNPGYDSLYAAYHPQSTDYFYYITGNDNQMHYAVTLDEHNANIEKYLR